MFQLKQEIDSLKEKILECMEENKVLKAQLSQANERLSTSPAGLVEGNRLLSHHPQGKCVQRKLKDLKTISELKQTLALAKSFVSDDVVVTSASQASSSGRRASAAVGRVKKVGFTFVRGLCISSQLIQKKIFPGSLVQGMPPAT